MRRRQPEAIGSPRLVLIRQLISSERGHMLRCNVLGGECCLMLLTPGRRFLRYRPPTVCSFVLGDQPSPRCEWSELIKPHRIIVSKSQRIISHPFEKYNVRFSFSPRPPSFCPRLAVPVPQSLPLPFSSLLFLCLSLRFVPECTPASSLKPQLPLPERESRGEEGRGEEAQRMLGWTLGCR